MPTSSELITRARLLASEAHEGQWRKAGGEPYFVHLESVARLVEEHDHADEIVVATAFLHDVLEDQPAYAERLRREMPAEVVSGVEALTERKHDEAGHKRPKAERFREFVDRLQVAPERVRRVAVPVSCADKIDNLRSLVWAESCGLGLLSRLNTQPDHHLPQLAELRRIYVGHVSPSLLAAFDAATQALEPVVRAWCARMGRHSLWIKLTPESVARVRALATLPILRGDHVTLAHAVDPQTCAVRDLAAGYALGAHVELRGRGVCSDGRVQVLIVELEGSSERAHDGGTLHVTIARAEDARSREANDVLRSAAAIPVEVMLEGVVSWEPVRP